MKNGEHFGKVWRLAVGKKERQCGLEIECVDTRRWMSRFLSKDIKRSTNRNLLTRHSTTASASIKWGLSKARNFPITS